MMLKKHRNIKIKNLTVFLFYATILSDPNSISVGESES